MREALAADQLQLHYQPVVRTKDHVVVGFEGLMRWEHPERGYVSPGIFIPAAEESNLINQLGEWALRRACDDAAAWPETVRVAVNVSAVQFNNTSFLAVVTNALAASGLAPDRLELELTESVFMGDSEATEKTFAALKELGVRLALDDFGTGYSSLSYLRSAPFDKLKVDKSFVEFVHPAGQEQRQDHHRDHRPFRSARAWRPRSRGSRRSTSSTSCASAAPSTSRGGSTRRRCRATRSPSG